MSFHMVSEPTEPLKLNRSSSSSLPLPSPARHDSAVRNSSFNRLEEAQMKSIKNSSSNRASPPAVTALGLGPGAISIASASVTVVGRQSSVREPVQNRRPRPPNCNGLVQTCSISAIPPMRASSAASTGWPPPLVAPATSPVLPPMASGSAQSTISFIVFSSAEHSKDSTLFLSSAAKACCLREPPQVSAVHRRFSDRSSRSYLRRVGWRLARLQQLSKEDRCLLLLISRAVEGYEDLLELICAEYAKQRVHSSRFFYGS